MKRDIYRLLIKLLAGLFFPALLHLRLAPTGVAVAMSCRSDLYDGALIKLLRLFSFLESF